MAPRTIASSLPGATNPRPLAPQLRPVPLPCLRPPRPALPRPPVPEPVTGEGSAPGPGMWDRWPHGLHKGRQRWGWGLGDGGLSRVLPIALPASRSPGDGLSPQGSPAWTPAMEPQDGAQKGAPDTQPRRTQGSVPGRGRSQPRSEAGAAAPTAQGAGGREGRGGREPGAGDDGHHRDRRVMPRAPVQPLKTRWWVDLGWALVPTQPLCHCPPQLGKGEKTRQKARGWRSGQGDHSASTLTGKTGSTRGN